MSEHRYQLWSGSPYGWHHDQRDTYRWRWTAKLMAWWRTGRLIRYEVRDGKRG